MNNKYQVLNHKTSITHDLIDHAENHAIWKTSFSNTLTYVSSIVEKDHKLSLFKNKFACECIIIKMNPNSFYKFHTDTQRKCALNILLAGFDSTCYFGERGSDGSDVVISNLIKVPYQPDTCVLLNTQRPHAIHNGDNVRYILSIGCFNYSFESVREWCQENNF